MFCSRKLHLLIYKSRFLLKHSELLPRKGCEGIRFFLFITMTKFQVKCFYLLLHFSVLRAIILKGSITVNGSTEYKVHKISFR